MTAETKNHGEDWGRAMQKLDSIETMVKQVADLCTAVARHDEQIKAHDSWLCSLDKRQWWLIGLIATAIAGLIIKGLTN